MKKTLSTITAALALVALAPSAHANNTLQKIDNAVAALESIFGAGKNKAQPGVRVGNRTFVVEPEMMGAITDNERALKMSFGKLLNDKVMFIHFESLGSGPRDIDLCSNPYFMGYTIMFAQDGKEAFLADENYSSMPAGKLARVRDESGGSPCVIKVLGTKTIFIEPPFWMDISKPILLHWSSMKLDIQLK